MSEPLIPPLHGGHGKMNNKAVLLGSLAAGGVLLYLFMHHSATGAVVPAVGGTGAPVDDTPVTGTAYSPGYGSDGSSYGGAGAGTVAGDSGGAEPPLTVGTTSIAPGPVAHKPHPTTVHHKHPAKHAPSHPAQVHTNPVHHKNVKHANEVMDSHTGGTNPSAHTEHHASPVPASNHHHPREAKHRG